jgi:hypothetical protein
MAEIEWSQSGIIEMNKRDFFKLVSGLVVSTAIPIPKSVPEFKPFGDLYNKFYPTLEGAWSALMTAEIDREMILKMLKIVIETGDPNKVDAQKTYAERAEIIRNLEFDIESGKTGYRVIANNKTI